MLEDAAYCRMLRIYYRTERPLPTDMKQVHRLVRAQSKPERDAVEQVLADFFELRDDGWHQSRCDAEIDRFQAGEPEREVKRANEDNRLKRHRDERAALFKALTDAGQHAPWNVGMAELRTLVKALQLAPPDTAVTPLPATAPATPATATQTPDTKHQTPDTSTKPGIPSLLPQAPALPPEGQPEITADGPQLHLVDPPPPQPSGPPDCPHPAVLALWAEVLPAMPQHLPSQWRGSRADHLRARWREAAVEKGWSTEAQGLAYLRKLFAYVGQSQFLTGRATSRDPAKRPFVIELEWLVNPTNWAKVVEGKYHTEAA